MTTKTELAEQVADAVRDTLLRLHTEMGLPVEAIISGAHAQIITMMTGILGGPMTAHCCEMAADRVRDLPSLNAVKLAVSPPAGQA